MKLVTDILELINHTATVTLRKVFLEPPAVILRLPANCKMPRVPKVDKESVAAVLYDARIFQETESQFD